MLSRDSKRGGDKKEVRTPVKGHGGILVVRETLLYPDPIKVIDSVVIPLDIKIPLREIGKGAIHPPIIEYNRYIIQRRLVCSFFTN